MKHVNLYNKKTLTMNNKKIKLINMDKWVNVDIEYYEKINEFEWFGVFLDTTQSIHAVREVEVEKGIFQLELMEEFIHHQEKKKKKNTKKINFIF